MTYMTYVKRPMSSKGILVARDPHHFTDDTKRGSGANFSTDALFALLGNDEEVMAKVRLLVNVMLENAFDVMLHGTVSERTALSRAMLPSIVKMVAAKDEGGVASLRDRMEKMLAEMAGGPIVNDAEVDVP